MSGDAWHRQRPVSELLRPEDGAQQTRWPALGRVGERAGCRCKQSSDEGVSHLWQCAGNASISSPPGASVAVAAPRMPGLAPGVPAVVEPSRQPHRPLPSSSSCSSGRGAEGWAPGEPWWPCTPPRCWGTMAGGTLLTELLHAPSARAPSVRQTAALLAQASPF